jgi:hypothetical protein
LGATTTWGNYCSQQAVLGVQWGERMVVGKWLGAVKNATPEQLLWTTLRRLEELRGEW